MHRKKVCENFKIKILSKYCNLYIQSDTLLSAIVFENFRNMCLEILTFDLAKFLSAPGLARQAAIEIDKNVIRCFN